MARQIKTRERCAARVPAPPPAAPPRARRVIARAVNGAPPAGGRGGEDGSPEAGAADAAVWLPAPAASRAAALGKGAARAAALARRGGTADPRRGRGAAAPDEPAAPSHAAPRGGRARGGPAAREARGGAAGGGPAARRSPARAAESPGRPAAADAPRARRQAAARALAARARAKGAGGAAGAGSRSARGRRGARATAEGLRTAARAAARAARSLHAVLAAAGAGAAAVVVVVCMAALVAASGFGIFLAGGDMGDGNPTLREVVARIDAAHAQKVEDARAANPADEVVVSGSKAAWSDVLAVFAARTAHDTENPLDVVTMDEGRQAALEDTFWLMNAVDVAVERREEAPPAAPGDQEGAEAAPRAVVTLRITLTHRDAAEAAELLGFTEEQRDILGQLTDPGNASLWQAVLSGAVANGSIVEVAVSQIGNIGGAPYWSWYGFASRVEWCACFVSWCANECGYLEAGALPKFSYCPDGVSWFRSRGLWQAAGTEPAAGSIVFFDWDRDGTSDHVGIVESCEGGTVRTVEGNTSNSCARRSYPVSSASIMGYGVSAY